MHFIFFYQDADKNADDIPVVKFHLNIPLQIQGKYKQLP